MVNLYEILAVVSDSALQASGVLNQVNGISYRGTFRRDIGPTEDQVIDDMRRVQTAVSGIPELIDFFEGFNFIIANTLNFGVPRLPPEEQGVDIGIVFWDQEGRRDGSIGVIRTVIV